MKESLEDIRINPPLIKETQCAKRLTKFWQKPSPKRKSIEKEEGTSKGISEDIPTTEFQKFLNQEEDKGQSTETERIEEAENEYIEQLSEELCRVFDSDNDEKDNKTQKRNS